MELSDDINDDKRDCDTCGGTLTKSGHHANPCSYCGGYHACEDPHMIDDHGNLQ